MNKVLVLGGGYLGNTIYNYLNQNKDTINNIEMISIRDSNNYQYKNYDLVIDTADKSRGIHDEIYKIKVESLRNIYSKSAPKYIYFSSTKVYAEGNKPIYEGSELSAKDEYASNKIINEMNIQKNSSNYIILRLSNIWSLQSPRGTFIGDQLIRIKQNNNIEINEEDYNNHIDLVYIDDLIKIIINLIHQNGRNRIYNATSGLSYNVGNIKEQFSKMMFNRNNDNDCMIKYLSTALKREMGFTPNPFSHYYSKLNYLMSNIK